MLAVTQIAFNLVSQMVQVDDDVTNSVAFKEEKGIFNHWPARHRNQRLGYMLGERMQPCSLASR